MSAMPWQHLCLCEVNASLLNVKPPFLLWPGFVKSAYYHAMPTTKKQAMSNRLYSPKFRDWFGSLKNIDGPVKSPKMGPEVIQAKAESHESSIYNSFWMPDQVRHDDLNAFFGSTNFEL